MVRLGVKSKQAVADFLAILEREGYITKEREINLTPRALQYLVDEGARSFGQDVTANYNVITSVEGTRQGSGEETTDAPVLIEYQEKVGLPSAESSPISTAVLREAFVEFLGGLEDPPVGSSSNKFEGNVTEYHAAGNVNVSYVGMSGVDSRISNTNTEVLKGNQLGFKDLPGLGKIFGKGI